VKFNYIQLLLEKQFQLECITTYPMRYINTYKHLSFEGNKNQTCPLPTIYKVAITLHQGTQSSYIMHAHVMHEFPFIPNTSYVIQL